MALQESAGKHSDGGLKRTGCLSLKNLFLNESLGDLGTSNETTTCLCRKDSMLARSPDSSTRW